MPHTPEPLEPALEALLHRIVPGLSEAWRGAAARELAELEAIARRPLPVFYQWFLSRMGKSMGPMGYPTVDFSVQGILAEYQRRSIEPHPRFLLIGFERDELMPLHYFYDLDQPVRNDALVVRMLTPRDESHEQFETFREMLAWGELWTQRVATAAQRCQGSLRHAAGSPYPELEAVLRRLGFVTPIETGAFCGLYERSDAILTGSGTPGDRAASHTFNLAGHDAATLGTILSAIADEAALEVTLSSWSPPLPRDA